MTVTVQNFSILLFLIITACRNDQPRDTAFADTPFRPKGHQADLVYNPVRPDGSIDSSYLPVLTWNEDIFDFGTITEGAEVTHAFSFTNTGTAPLLILSATSTCGCTIPEWPKDPIAPGGRGEIKVIFNSTNKTGDQSKDVTIFANTFPNQTRVTISGKVLNTN